MQARGAERGSYGRCLNPSPYKGPLCWVWFLSRWFDRAQLLVPASRLVAHASLEQFTKAPAQQVRAADRFAREIGPFLKTGVCALAAGDAQSVGRQAITAGHPDRPGLVRYHTVTLTDQMRTNYDDRA